LKTYDLKNNKIFIVVATAFLSGSLSFCLSELNVSNFSLVFLGSLLISFIYIVATLKLSFSKSLLIAVCTSLILYKFSTEAAINLLEMAFLGSFITETIIKGVNPKISLPFVSLILAILSLIEVNFGTKDTYKILKQTLGPYLIGFLFIVASFLSYLVYAAGLYFIKGALEDLKLIFYPRALSIILFLLIIINTLVKSLPLLNIVLGNLILFLLGILFLEGLSLCFMLLKKVKNIFIKILLFTFLIIFPYIFIILGIISNLFKLPQKLFIGGDKHEGHSS